MGQALYVDASSLTANIWSKIKNRLKYLELSEFLHIFAAKI
jgi:hypothetical protein